MTVAKWHLSSGGLYATSCGMYLHNPGEGLPMSHRRFSFLPRQAQCERCRKCRTWHWSGIHCATQEMITAVETALHLIADEFAKWKAKP